jgi:transposase
MGRPRVYSDEFRRRAIEEVVVRGRALREVARDLGIAPETLRRWIAETKAQESGAPPSPEVVEELKKLRKEVADQQRTIEILKAATTYFREGSRPSKEVMTGFVDEHRDGRSRRCAAIGLSERTYYAAKARPVSARAIATRRR